MKVYSDKLTEADLREALPCGVGADIHAIRNARVRRNGWVVSVYKVGGTRWKNTGKYGAGSEKAASYDEHGEWMAQLFSYDPSARISWWKDAEDFDRGTDGKFAAAVRP